MLISVLLVSHNNQKDLEILLPSLVKALNHLEQSLNFTFSAKGSNGNTDGKISNGNIDGKERKISKPICHNSSLSEILLVDNCSSDSTVDFVQKHFPNVLITKNRKKMGYGANQNQNIAKAKGKFLLIMNPDMVLPPNLFNIMVKFMDDHKDAGIATCKVCNLDGSSQYLNKREPTIFDLFVRRFFPNIRKIYLSKSTNTIQELHNTIVKRLDMYEMRDVGYDKVVDVPFVSGSFMFTRASLIKELNGFDERFFMYFEDVDLCKRVRNKARSLYCPDVSVIHRWDRASHKSLKWTIVFILSGLKYFHKWGFRFI
ncbi:MAG: glycosyltransferase family 2 protein [Desulfamplus sp.]|nr:glycosyltransferase family 2 protein [Desulfamplus sp.]